jgi:hypothetical protein
LLDALVVPEGTVDAYVPRRDRDAEVVLLIDAVARLELAKTPAADARRDRIAMQTHHQRLGPHLALRVDVDRGSWLLLD